MDIKDHTVMIVPMSLGSPVARYGISTSGNHTPDHGTANRF